MAKKKWLLYHPESDSYLVVESVIAYNENMKSGELDDVTDVPLHVNRYKAVLETGDLPPLNMHPESRPLTQSMIRCWNTCKRKYYWSYVLMIKPKRLHIPYMVGGASHVGVAGVLKKNSDRLIAKRVQAVIDSYIDDAVKNLGSLSVEMDQEVIFQTINIRAIIENYSRFYKDHIQKIKVIAEEKKMVFEDLHLAGNFRLVIKPDAIITYEGKRYVWEFKTQKSLGYEGIQYHIPQGTIYFIGAKDRYRLDGIYFDCIKKPMLKMGKNESVEDFMERLAKNYEGPDNYYFDFMTPSKKYQADIIRLIDTTAIDIADHEERLDLVLGEIPWPTNRFACHQFGQCEFLLLCNEGMNNITRMKYTEKSSPNEELEEKESE